MSNSNRRDFLKTAGQGTLAAGMVMGFSGSARADGAEEAGQGKMAWPYPIAYGKETQVVADVLVLGGGVAGCWAAIGAARKGLKVALVEKGCTIRSGSNGSGVDHWQFAATNPASRVSADEMAQSIIDASNGYISAIGRWIKTHDGYDRLLELEQMGVKIRDEEDDFKGADFRDEKTKLLFAYNYYDRTVIRFWGTALKPALAKECKRLGVKIYDRVMATSLLSEKGQPGSRIVGAAGVNTRTGEFLIFEAKATVLTTAGPSRLWQFVDNLGYSAHRPAVCSGDGFAMAWKAGATFTMMEASGLGTRPGVGMASGGSNATWYPCSLVDANGKEVPWVDVKGNPISTVSQRSMPPYAEHVRMPRPLSGKELEGQITKGKFALPLYADLTSMPAQERKAIYSLMVAQEGLSAISYRIMTKAGFDPNKDMLQVYEYHYAPDVREIHIGQGGLVIDWNLRTNLEGLYAAGEQAFGTFGCSGSATTGNWAGSKAADYAQKTDQAPVDRQQIDNEKKRVYAPINQNFGVLWKDLENGVAKIMQDYCGDVKNEERLQVGNKWLTELIEGEVKQLRARTPHELMHALEASNIAVIGQMVIHASMARKASCRQLGFQRSDFPLDDPPEWHKYVTIKLDRDQVKVGELPINYASPLAENYAKFK